jgi:16S rRNA (cytidine1402-2'-O)-methyltransferase
VLVLVPTFLGPAAASDLFPEKVQETIRTTRVYIAENAKTARHHLKAICPEISLPSLVVHELNKHQPEQGIREFLQPALEGETVALISEAGVPGVADPGALVVAEAHRLGIRVVPLVGPSSLLLALMASGLNGQQFAFNGYLPVEPGPRKKMWSHLEQKSAGNTPLPSAQLLIETPYRNTATFESALQSLRPDTYLCVAMDLTTETEWIKTLRISEWKKASAPNLHKRPCIFILQAESGRRV